VSAIAKRATYPGSASRRPSSLVGTDRTRVWKVLRELLHERTSVRSSLPSAGPPIHKGKLPKKGKPRTYKHLRCCPGTPERAVPPREGLSTRRGHGAGPRSPIA
jgi:hypothetical protein